MLHETRIKLAVTCMVAVLSMAPSAMAANNRSWVSEEGNDHNDCSIDHPCQTFQRAHDLTNTGGEVDVLSPGDYGPLVINRSITIDGGNMGYIQSIGFNPQAIKVAAAGSDVTLRNLSISRAASSFVAYGILWTSGNSLSVEGVSIDGFDFGLEAAAELAIVGQTVTPRVLLIKNTNILDFRSAGIMVQSLNETKAPQYPVNAIVDHTVVETAASAAGVFGIEVALGKTQVIHSVVSGGSNGVRVVGGEVNVEDSSIVYAGAGIVVGGETSVVRIGGNDIHGNTVALFANGGQIISFGDNQIAGNGSGETPTSSVALK